MLDVNGNSLAGPLILGTFEKRAPGRYQICFANCLYCYRDDLAEKVRKTTAQEWKTPHPVDKRRSKTSLPKVPKYFLRRLKHVSSWFLLQFLTCTQLLRNIFLWAFTCSIRINLVNVFKILRLVGQNKWNDLSAVFFTLVDYGLWPITLA